MGANDAIPGAGDDALMIEDHSSLPIVTRLHAWAATLPSFAAEVVSRADITRPHIYTQFAAVPDQVQVARAKVTDWIQRIGLSTAQGQDVVLAADEAVSNAVDHAYPDAPGTLTLFAACTRLADAARIIVSDHGCWRPPSATSGMRGRGLPMMERLSDVFRLAHTPRGTTVLLGWSLPG